MSLIIIWLLGWAALSTSSGNGNNAMLAYLYICITARNVRELTEWITLSAEMPAEKRYEYFKIHFNISFDTHEFVLRDGPRDPTLKEAKIILNMHLCFYKSSLASLPFHCPGIWHRRNHLSNFAMKGFVSIIVYLFMFFLLFWLN